MRVLLLWWAAALGAGLARERARGAANNMTLDEKLAWVAGRPGPYVGNLGGTDRLGLPPLTMEDGAPLLVLALFLSPLLSFSPLVFLSSCPSLLLSFSPPVLLSSCLSLLLSFSPPVLLSSCPSLLLSFSPPVLLSSCPSLLLSPLL